MKLKEIKTATKLELSNALGDAYLSQGIGHNFSNMVENRIVAIKKEMAKRAD